MSSPAVNSTFLTTETVAVNGSASVGLGVPDVAYIFVIDTSLSTDEPDGDCGTVLDCVQAFFSKLHREANKDGSAELLAVINFDDIAHPSEGFLHPRKNSRKIEEEIAAGYPGGGTNCNDALLATTELVRSPKNTAGTTVVVFAGDGLCNEDYDPTAADELQRTGAIVHTVAVGDSVDCNISATTNYDDDTVGDYMENSLVDITQNGGVCTSVPDPETLPHIIDELIGTTLKAVKFQIDGGNYTHVPAGNLSDPLPREGATEVAFEMELPRLAAGRHEICVRAAGEDSLGGWANIEDCHEFTVAEPVRTGYQVELWLFCLVVSLTLIVVLSIGYVVIRRVTTGKEFDSQDSSSAASAPSDIHNYVSPKPVGARNIV
uniref:VWFA domain-containing protein n=1 Tax=Grammatophora oceanica TaxID=210454 RepID=A0A7S1UPZ4_9STRA